jgi:O-antigen/teichoic acid export membrane protein
VFLRALALIWASSCPLAGLLVAIGEPAVVVLLGEQWRGAGVALVAMAGFGPGVAMSAVGFEAIKGCGRSRLVNWLTLTSVLAGLGLLVLLLPLGLVGVGLAISIDSLLVGVLALVLARQVVTVSPGDLARALLPPLVATLVAMGVIGAEHLLVGADQHSVVLALGLLAAESLGFAVLFVIVMAVIAPQQSRRLAHGVRDFVRPGRG